MTDTQWHGVLLARSAFNPAFVEVRDRLADAAKAGDWGAVTTIIDSGDVGANDWRIGGTSWFSPLHQAAWLGAPEDVVHAVVARGAWRTLRDADGQRPVDIARERGNEQLIDALTPSFASALAAADIEAMNGRLAELVTESAHASNPADTPIRHFDIAGLAEAGGAAWFPIPGMYGGYAIELFRDRLQVESWSRVVGGSGRAYVITAGQTVLVDQGFV